MTDFAADRFVRAHLKMRQLVLLVELGRHGTIVHAAHAAHLTQPAASKLLGELEYALGVPLFERHARGITPTAYGEVMIRRAGAALAELDAAHQEIMELQSGLSGRVAIGTVMTPSIDLVPRAVTALKRQHARLAVTITVDASKVLLQRLRAGELDILIGRILDADGAAEFAFEPLADEPHSLIARAGHPLAARTDLTLAELARAPWILPPAGSILRDRLTALFVSHGLDQPAESVETTALPVITSLLQGSDMIVALPEALVQRDLAAGMLTVLPYAPGLRMDMVGIITRRQHRLSPGAQAMLATLRAIVAKDRQD